MFIDLMLAGQFGPFLSVAFLSNTVILLKLKRKEKNPQRYNAHILAGIIISGTLLLPLIITPYTIYQADASFTQAFGSDWRDKIPDEIEEQYFMNRYFSMAEYFLGIPPKDCVTKTHISFYNGTSGVDDGISLFFDAYLPPNGGVGLPGENSTIIKIHGGGWIFGDKGWGNMPQVSKYFAAQGYVVFDVQYGIKDLGWNDIDPLTPKYKKGDFSVDDMVRHMGLFVKYISNHSTEYGANLDSVFVTGGSAGGHMTFATALGIWSGRYTSFFGTNLTIKGMIPYYPANGQMEYLGVLGTVELMSPEQMLNATSPPTLIFQGTHDILNMFDIAKNIKNIYTSYNRDDCAIIWLHEGGHASDIYFNGYHNLIFLYYMERFLYLYH